MSKKQKVNVDDDTKSASLHKPNNDSTNIHKKRLLVDCSDDELKHIKLALDVKAKRHELKEKEFKLELQKDKVCRIEVAQCAIQELQGLYLEQLSSIPTELQQIAPEINPEQYQKILDLIDTFKRVLGKKAVELTFEPVHEVYAKVK